MAESTGSVDGAEFRRVLGHFATGVTVVTSSRGEDPLGLTCQAFTSLSLDPPLVAVAVSKASTSWSGIAASGTYCVNILASGQTDLARNFALSGGRKFDGIGWSWSEGHCPLIDHHLGYVECSITAIHDVGDHILAVGLVTSLGIGRDRAPEPDRGSEIGPLLYYRSKFRDLPPQPGRGHGTGPDAVELQR
jgi:flavin reductase (DIM6/NTAB) family NADH-FMN oxidoreductase RutF